MYKIIYPKIIANKYFNFVLSKLSIRLILERWALNEENNIFVCLLKLYR